MKPSFQFKILARCKFVSRVVIAVTPVLLSAFVIAPQRASAENVDQVLSNMAGRYQSEAQGSAMAKQQEQDEIAATARGAAARTYLESQKTSTVNRQATSGTSRYSGYAGSSSSSSSNTNNATNNSGILSQGETKLDGKVVHTTTQYTNGTKEYTYKSGNDIVKKTCTSNGSCN